MLKSTKAKGNRIQRKLIEELESYGWLVDKVEKTGRFVKQKDLFGLFDLISIKKHKIQFIQVTCNKPHKHTPYSAFAKQFGHHRLDILQYVWYDRKGWVIHKYTWDMGIVKEDKRK